MTTRPGMTSHDVEIRRYPMGRIIKAICLFLLFFSGIVIFYGFHVGSAGAACECTTCHAANHHGNTWPACSTCHGAPPATGSHAVHSAPLSNTTYGDTVTNTAGLYQFGCGHCHSMAVTTRAAHRAPRNAVIQLTGTTGIGQTGQQVCAECHGNDGPHGTDCGSSGNCSSCHSTKTMPAHGSPAANTPVACESCHTQLHTGVPPSISSTCSHCHGVGGVGPNLTEAQLSAIAAPSMHAMDPVQVQCSACHVEILQVMHRSSDPGSPAFCLTCHNSPLHEEVPFNVNTSCAVCHGGDAGSPQPGVPPLSTADLQFEVNRIHDMFPRPDFMVSYSSAQSYLVDFTAYTASCPSGVASCTYNWTFGDGTTGTGMTISHTYPGTGPYTATLRVVTSANTDGSINKSINPLFINQPPVASFSLSFDANTWTATVIDTSTDDLGIIPNGVTIRWGDGSSDAISQGGSKSHAYAAAATYTITTVVIDSATPSLSSVSAGQTVSPANFTISGTVSPYTGGSSALANGVLMSLLQDGAVKANTYTNASGAYSFSNVKRGTYDVRALKTGYGFVRSPQTVTVGPSQSAINFTIANPNIQPPVVNFGGSPLSGDTPLSVSFTDLSTGNPVFWSWSFGDGGTSTEKNPVHMYRTPGTYTVSLSAYNEGGVGMHSITGYVTVAACANQPVRITGAAPIPFNSLQAAYNAAADGDTVAVQSLNFTEVLNFNRAIQITLRGGYDCAYTANSSQSTINGSLAVSNGTVIVENVVIQ